MIADYEDGKDDGALRTIGEVSRAVGIKTHVLRYWEQQFSMLEPLKRSGGRRYYRPADVTLIERIDRLVNGHGYTLKGARQAIEADKNGSAVAPSDDDEPSSVSRSDIEPTDSIISETEEPLSRQEIRERLAILRDNLSKAASL